MMMFVSCGIATFALPLLSCFKSACVGCFLMFVLLDQRTLL